MANDFFKNGDKAYSENLNDGLLVGNAFDWTVSIGLPADNGGVFPNSSTVVKAKVADVSITPNSNLSIGSTISNSSGSSQVYRLTVYPDFNRFGGFKSISLTADSGVTFYIANKGGTTPIANNLDYSNLGNVPELKVLKEYDIVLTIPTGKSVTGLSFVFQSNSASVSASLLQSNVTGLSDSLAGKSDTNHNHDDRYYTKTGITDWEQYTTTDPYVTAYYNSALRLFVFRYYRQNFEFTTTNEISLGLGLIPSIFAPVMNTILSSYNATIIGAVLTDGTLTVQTTSTGTKTINLTGMWHY